MVSYADMADTIDLKQAAATSVFASLKAGKAIMEVYRSKQLDVQIKDDNSPLTRADTHSQQIIHQALAEEFPTIPFVGEEGPDIPYSERRGWRQFWLVDPLDGTKEFIKGNGEFTTNIALIRGSRPVMGVIYAPVVDTLYLAVEGEGAYRISAAQKIKELPLSFESVIADAEILRLKDRVNEEQICVLASRSHRSKEADAFIELLKTRYHDCRFISSGSSLKLCLLAEGTAQIYPRFAPTMEWDTAAGQAILEEIGGTILSYPENTPLRYNKENLRNPWFLAGSLPREDTLSLARAFNDSR